jgi:hypothetical protein
MKNNLLPIIQTEYGNFFERKGKYESKSIGFIAFVSILLSISWGLFLNQYGENDVILFHRKIFFIIELSLNYWALWVIIHALIAIWPRTIEKIDRDDIILNAFNIEKDEDYDLKLLSTYYDIIRFNSPILIKIEFHNKLSSLYLFFVFCIFGVQLIFFCFLCIAKNVF